MNTIAITLLYTILAYIVGGVFYIEGEDFKNSAISGLLWPLILAGFIVMAISLTIVKVAELIERFAVRLAMRLFS